MNNKNIMDVSEIDFEKNVLEESVNKLVVVDFWAPWCGPCKQLTPVLEKIISSYPERILLAKVNIDENQQIAAQLRIQSIPAVFAFKDKQLVNAFQGVIPEKEIIKFIEKGLGEKLENNFDDFYEEVNLLLKNKDFSLAKEKLEDFISNNSNDINAVCLYAACLIDMEEVELAKEFLDSLNDEILKNEEIKKIIKRIDLIKQNNEGPSIDELNEKLKKSPENLGLVFEISDKYFANNDFNNCFEILIKFYPKNKDKVKLKILDFFEVLGPNHESVILYRKKLSSVMFS